MGDHQKAEKDESALSQVSLEQFLRDARRLIESERNAEVEDARRRLDAVPSSSNPLGKMRLSQTAGARGGATAVTLVADDLDVGIPRGALSVGDLVRIAPRKVGAARQFKVTGVITRIATTGVTVAVGGSDLDGLDEQATKQNPPGDDDETGIEDLSQAQGYLRVDKVANDVTYSRMRWALAKLESRFAVAGQNQIVDLFFHNQRALPTWSDHFKLPAESKEKGLNESQSKAVGLILNSDLLACVWGPPGTGKTTVLVEAINACVTQKNEKVLATAPSNVAVDTLTERLIARNPRLRIVRLGHPARMASSVVDASLSSRVAAEFYGVGLDITKEMDGIHRQLRNPKTPRHERRNMYRLLRQLQRELREREQDTTRMILSQAQVILATCAGAGDRTLNKLDRQFDVVVIDEAAQALEPAAWIPAGLGKRLVLCGDNMQLAPVTMSTSSEVPTMFDRARFLTSDSATVMLRTQYRMNTRIAEWASKQSYQERLLSSEDVAHHLLSTLPHVKSTDDTNLPLIFVDTAGCDFEEERDVENDDEGQSYRNPGEAKIVLAHVIELVTAGVLPSEIAVISPYSGQTRLLEKSLHRFSGLEIDTVDGFQGREKEAVIISLVRSNDEGAVGFLRDRRRLNVAVTRARRQVLVTGDSCTVAGDDFIQTFLDWVEENGQYRSAWDYRS